MIKKQTKNNSNIRLEKIVIVSGLAIIVFGCAANIYSALVNQRFMHDMLDYVYYFRYLILLGGGFVAGYFLQRKVKKQTMHVALLRGVIYATLATALFWIFDIIRLLINFLPGEVGFPMGRILFLGMPLFAIISTLLIAYIVQYRRNESVVGSSTKKSLVVLFAIFELYKFAMVTFYLGSWGTLSWNTVIGILTIPAVIAAVAFLLLGRIKSLFDRLFYATIIASFAGLMTVLFWELRTDVSTEGTEFFAYISYAVTILVAGALILLARKAVR